MGAMATLVACRGHAETSCLPVLLPLRPQSQLASSSMPTRCVEHGRCTT